MDTRLEILCEIHQGGEEKSCPLAELKHVEHF
jgi:hypothetical protein